MFVRCPHCGQAASAPKGSPEKTFRCPTCSRLFQLAADATAKRTEQQVTVDLADKAAAMPAPLHPVAADTPTVTATPAVVGDASTVDAAPDTPATATDRLSSPTPGPGLPQQAGRYIVQGKIAEGGMGAVLRVADPAFERTLAVKIMLPRGAGNPTAVRRFLEEARLTGRLQHPGIPPVHELGRLDNGLPFFAMKLIEGRTLARLLKDRGPKADDHSSAPEPHLLGIFRQVCQTIAYAHSRGVIHRDLKPANIMVGAFGEVQVMDWGLAKSLAHLAEEPTPPAADAALPEAPTEAADALSRTGDAMGTPGYMAPEQARGEVRTLDERCDVFGLGAILCELLTGAPPFARGSALDRVRQTADGDLADALARLERCAADAELVALCRHCLAPRPEDRPRHAGVVAEAVEHYEDLVQERLRQAELARHRAELQAQEDRRRRRVQLALAAALFLLLAGAGGAALWYQQDRAARASRHEAREDNIRAALGQARQARAALLARLDRRGGVFALLDRPAEWLQQIEAARAGLKRARDLAGDAEAPVAAALAEAITELDARLRQDDADRRLALRLEQVREDKAFPRGKYLDYARVDQGYAQAFQDAHLPLAPGREEELAARVRRSPIKEHLLATLDDWALNAQAQGRPDLQRRLLQVARRVDPGPWRDQVRDLKSWTDRALLQRLARQALAEDQRLAQFSPQLLFLVGALLENRPEAEEWLRRAQALHPGDFWLSFQLAKALEDAQPARAEGYYRAALAVRPDSAAAHNNLGLVLEKQKDFRNAVRHYRKAVELNPRVGALYNNLGLALRDLKDFPGAIRQFRKALRLDPKLAMAHANWGLTLYEQHDLPGAAVHLRKAVELDPTDPHSHIALAKILSELQDAPAAERHLRQALRLAPASAVAHQNLGILLQQQKDLPGAIRHYREAVRLNPRLDKAHNNLGNILRQRNDLAGARTHLKAALEIDPGEPRAHFNLALVCGAEGDFQGAAAHLQRVLELIPPQHPQYPVTQRLLADCRQELARLRRVSRILQGAKATPAELLTEAEWSMTRGKRFADAVQLYKAAFALEPKLADDLSGGSRTQAARAALQAAAGEGQRAQDFAAEDKAGLRRQALDWLRADLKLLAGKVPSAPPPAAVAQDPGGLSQPSPRSGDGRTADVVWVKNKLEHWRSDAALNSVRDAAALAALPADERQAWQQFWADVDHLLRQCRRWQGEANAGTKERAQAAEKRP